MYILIIILFITQIHAGQTQSIPIEKSEVTIKIPETSTTPDLTFHFHNNLDNNLHNNIGGGSFSTSVNTSAQSTSLSHAHAQNSSFQQTVLTIIPDSYKNSITATLSHILRNKIWYALLASYSGIATTLIAGNHYVNSDTRWSRWKKEYSLVDLCTQPTKQITHELVIEIQRRYLDRRNPTNFLSPLIQFLNNIDREAFYIRHYLRTMKLISFLRITMIFPTNASKKEQAQQALDRIQCIRHLFVTWMSEYNIGNVLQG